jgi:hypothetical protein
MIVNAQVSNPPPTLSASAPLGPDPKQLYPLYEELPERQQNKVYSGLSELRSRCSPPRSNNVLLTSTKRG